MSEQAETTDDVQHLEEISVEELEAAPAQFASECCSKAFSILHYADDSCRSMLRAYKQDLQRRGERRGDQRGAPTDEQMDLLRAMLVFAGAGLDSMLKQLIRDALQDLLEVDESVRKGLHGFTTNRLKPSGALEPAVTASGFLASLLVSGSPRDAIIEAYTDDLTGGSLQSASQLKRSLSALGLPPRHVLSNETHLGDAFVTRNLIVHELDIDFAQARRNRRTRPLNQMVEYTNTILRVSGRILTLIDEKLTR